MAIVTQTHIPCPDGMTISEFETNLINYFESLDDSITAVNDTTNNTITFNFGTYGGFKITRSGTWHYLDIIKNGVEYRCTNPEKLTSSRYGWEIYSVIDTNLFLIWVSVPTGASYFSGSLYNLLNTTHSSGQIGGFMLAIIPDTNNNEYIGHYFFNSMNSSSSDILDKCSLEKCGDSTIGSMKMFNIFDYKSKIGYLDFVYGATFGAGTNKSFKCSAIANSSTVVPGESYSLSSGSYFSVNKYALLSVNG